MGLLNFLGLNTDIAKPIEAISDLYTTDKAKLAAEAALEEVMQKRGLSQLENNKIMLMASNGFESLWIPLIGWTSGFCVALFYIPQLIVVNLEWSLQVLETHQITPFPIDPTDILNLVYLLFGFGTYHIAKKKLLGK
jgi:hypothetical protein